MEYLWWLFPSQGKNGNNVLQLAGKPLRLSLKDKTDSKLLLKSNLKTNSENICWPFDSLQFFHASLSTYFPSLFHCISCPSFFISHHFSLTVSSNPALRRWCPWKGGPLFTQWLLWSLAISSPGMQSMISFPYFPSHLLISLLISSTCSTSLLTKFCFSGHSCPFSPLLSSLSLWSTKFPSISTLALSFFTLAWLDSDIGLLQVLLKLILKQLQVLNWNCWRMISHPAVAGFVVFMYKRNVNVQKKDFIK